MKWAGVRFTVELPCGKQVDAGTLEEIREREAAGILPGPDPCAEVEDMSARADLTGVTDNGTAVSNGASILHSNLPNPSPDLTVGSPCVQLPPNGHVRVAHLEPLPVGYEEFACVGFWQFC